MTEYESVEKQVWWVVRNIKLDRSATIKMRRGMNDEDLTQELLSRAFCGPAVMPKQENIVGFLKAEYYVILDELRHKKPISWIEFDNEIICQIEEEGMYIDNKAQAMEEMERHLEVAKQTTKMGDALDCDLLLWKQQSPNHSTDILCQKYHISRNTLSCRWQALKRKINDNAANPDFLSNPVKKSKFIDMTGLTFNDLTVIGKAPDHPERVGQSRWLCVCSCGEETVKAGSDIRAGRVKSCGHRLADFRKKVGHMTKDEIESNESWIHKQMYPGANDDLIGM